MIRKLSLIVAALIGLAIPVAPAAHADPLAKDVFGSFRSANAGPKGAIGSYSRGCASGNVQLPESGPTWQAMRLSRNRNWGQPELIDFLVGLSRAATQVGWPGLYIGDLSQPRGGPMVSGHASHQIGLDADIWMLPPQSLRLSPQQRENISSVSVVAQNGLGMSRHWSAGHAALIRAAAMDPRVDRIFLDAAIKVEMCRMNNNRGAWLQKLRPTPNHDYHFHVRLHCNSGSCNNPATPVAQLSGNDNGCGEAAQELRYRANPSTRPRGTPNPDYRHPRTFRLSELPRQCTNVAGAR
ncbi:MAG: penicillin-insensitive murein endopeptidase [Paracoccus sp. (in: a-proteobacteria)]|uniref:penicillin-insensitive murein endopeptidase n=1 Tax=Paracoccus sp. TaxID=267 RepID=UPI0026E0D3FC|nr:penicillin-insensitive murein endopeptidase [Paracoccus sp. (in: a-proteobacteria)]MDO5612612.1 penicillin-insensitive murein endopeptidase [Paracoccus sp. (in: a-proteobacteria)]